MAAHVLTEDDIPGASLAGRAPAALKNDELRWAEMQRRFFERFKNKSSVSEKVSREIASNFAYNNLSNIYTCNKSRN